MRMKSVLALSVLSASVFASTLGQASTCSNFLLGGELGWARQKEGYNLQFVAPSLPVAPITHYNFPARSAMITDQGMIFGLLAGWQVRYDRWLAGIEANVDFQEFEETRGFAFTDNVTGVHGVAGTVLYERGPVWALTLRGGYFVTPGFMPYVRLGAQYSRDEATIQENISINAGGLAFPDFNSKREHLWGAVAGVGVEFPAFIGPSTVRFEYTYAVSENMVIDDGALPILGTHNFIHPHPETSAIKFAWVWNFA